MSAIDGDLITAELIDFLCSAGTGDEQTPATSSPNASLAHGCAGCAEQRASAPLLPGTWAYPVACHECGRWCFCGWSEQESWLDNESARSFYARLVAALKGDSQETAARLESSRQKTPERAARQGPENRRSVRMVRSSPIVVAPLNSQGLPSAPASRATLMDYSEEGVGFLYEAREESPYFLIDFSLGEIDRVQQLARAAWKREVNRYTKHGCQVLTDVEEL